MRKEQFSIGKKQLKVPIIQGGMGVGISLGGLAGAVAKEGGAGTISAAQIGFREPDFYENPVEANKRAIHKEMDKARKISPEGVIGFNLMVAMNDYETYVREVIAAGADFIVSGAGLPVDLPAYIKDSDIAIAPIVSTRKSAHVILKFWDKKYKKTADFIVIEGSQAGGHLGFKKEDLENQTCQSLEEIFKDVEEIVENNKLNIPIFVAGGISQRSDVKHFFDLGVDGIQVATRFITTYECDASIKYKEAFLKARKEDIGFVSSPVGMPGRAMQNSFVKKTKKEKIPVKKCYQCLIPCDVKNTPYCISRALIEAVKGNLEDGLIFTGAHGYRQDHLMHVDEVIHELMEDDK